MPSGLSLPDTTRTGARRWTDPSIARLLDQLWHGDATLGWEGDDRLGLFESDDGVHYELWRAAERGPDEMVAKAPKTRESLSTLIVRLVEHDTRKRSTDAIIEGVFAEQERTKQAEWDASVEEAVDTFYTAATRHARPSARSN